MCAASSNPGRRMAPRLTRAAPASGRWTDRHRQECAAPPSHRPCACPHLLAPAVDTCAAAVGLVEAKTGELHRVVARRVNAIDGALMDLASDPIRVSTGGGPSPAHDEARVLTQLGTDTASAARERSGAGVAADVGGNVHGDRSGWERWAIKSESPRQDFVPRSWQPAWTSTDCHLRLWTALLASSLFP